ncbi:hypothetical protein Droror1_Dr00003067 [Drosera rotundifolia]
MKLKKALADLRSFCGPPTTTAATTPSPIPAPNPSPSPMITNNDKKTSLNMATATATMSSSATRRRRPCASAADWRPSLPAISENGGNNTIVVVKAEENAKVLDRGRWMKFGSKSKRKDVGKRSSKLVDTDSKWEMMIAMIPPAAPAPFVF